MMIFEGCIPFIGKGRAGSMMIFPDKDGGEKGGTKGDWSSGMIPALGAGGPGFNSRIAPFCIGQNIGRNGVEMG